VKILSWYPSSGLALEVQKRERVGKDMEGNEKQKQKSLITNQEFISKTHKLIAFISIIPTPLLLCPKCCSLSFGLNRALSIYTVAS
jgi:hypothetical protein